MSGDPNARSSDLAHARELSQRLRRAADSVPADPFSPEPVLEPVPARPGAPLETSFGEPGAEVEPGRDPFAIRDPSSDGPRAGSSDASPAPGASRLRELSWSRDISELHGTRELSEVSRPSPARPRTVPPERTVPPGLASMRWDARLRSVLEIAADGGASAAFAVDAHGLVIGQEGPVDGEAIEATASRLAIVAEQAARMEAFAETPPRAILIEFASGWLTALRVDDPLQGPIVLGIVASSPLAADLRSLLAERIEGAPTEDRDLED